MSTKNSGAFRKNASPGKSKGQTKTVTPINAGTSATFNLTQVHPEIVDEVRVRAYELYEQRGRQDGNDQDDWIRAEEEILSRYQKVKSA